MANVQRPDFCLANGMFDEIGAPQFEGRAVKPDNPGMEFTGDSWQMIRRYQHVAPAEVDLLIQLQRHRHGGASPRKFPIVSHDGAHSCFLPRGKRYNSIAGMN